MRAEAPRLWTRRAVLLALPLLRLRADAGKGQAFPAELIRYADPSTEFPVYRLTGLDHASFLPAWNGRAVARRGSFLLFYSDRQGRPQAFRMERTGGIQQLTEAADLDGSSLTLARDDGSFYFFDGPVLWHSDFRKLREKEIYRVPEGWTRRNGFCLSPDGSRAVLVETQGTSSRLRLIRTGRHSVSTVVEGPFDIADPQPRPRRDTILYRQGAGSLWLVNYDGRQNRRLPAAPGGIGPAFWSPDGRTVFYLSFPEDRQKLNSIREINPEANTDALVAPTSQFVSLDANADASVFVGASRNKASPHVLLLLRATRREFTLCEHRASDPAQVAPVFSPDSRWIYFQSDRDGKPAIYGMPVERLVEPTEAERPAQPARPLPSRLR